MMLIRNTGRQLRPAIFASMMKPGQDRAAGCAEAQHGPEAGEGLGEHVLRECLGHDGHALRDEERAEPALHDPGDDKHGRTGGQAADGRGEGEAGHADEEQPPLAVPVAQSPAHDQQRAHGQRVAGAKPFDQRWPAAQMGHDGRGSDVSDGRIE
jgi:hypothetical protein